MPTLATKLRRDKAALRKLGLPAWIVPARHTPAMAVVLDTVEALAFAEATLAFHAGAGGARRPALRTRQLYTLLNAARHIARADEVEAAAKMPKAATGDHDLPLPAARAFNTRELYMLARAREP